MSVQKVAVMIPPVPAAPPAAVWAAEVAAWLLGGDPQHPTGLPAGIAALRRSYIRRRAIRRQARDRIALMALARRYGPTQPEFAKELVAAANADR